MISPMPTPSSTSYQFGGLPPDPTGGKRALVLSGGGVTGLTYEIGTLRALDDLLVGATVNDFDIFVGTSAGSVVGALLANGISPTAMALGVQGNTGDLSPPSAWALYKPNLGEFATRLLRLPGLARELAGDMMRSPLKLSAFDLMGLLFPLVPSGLFDHSELIRYIHDVLSLPGLTDMGMRGVYNQVFRGVLHDGLIDHVRLVRNRRPDVDILLIEPRPDDEKMFFHELMSFSARLMTLQHGYESVSTGLYDTWGYLRRILPKHGIRITRRVIDRKPQQVPVETVESAGRLQRLLRQTVFDRRSRARQLGEDEAPLREREAV
jgi:hypothetical protein